MFQQVSGVRRVQRGQQRRRGEHDGGAMAVRIIEFAPADPGLAAAPSSMPAIADGEDPAVSRY